MATVAVGNILSTVVVCSCPEQVAVHVLWHRVLNIVGAPPITTARVALAIDTALAPLMKSLMAPYATYVGVQTRVFFPLNAERWAISKTLSGVGTATGNPLPTQTTGLLAIQGSVWGAAGSGRWYLPFPSAADDDVFASPGPTYLGNAANLGDWVVAQLSVTSSPAGGTATLGSVLFNRTTKVDNLVTDYIVRDAWATQKRRGSFGRLNRSPI